jgi:hypothetical protein
MSTHTGQSPTRVREKLPEDCRLRDGTFSFAQYNLDAKIIISFLNVDQVFVSIETHWFSTRGPVHPLVFGGCSFFLPSVNFPGAGLC